ncbi:unnamed protein product [Hyaloperonospora brassicae]|nr:unnamed protein product [Hyaloperonospora brassicae]
MVADVNVITTYLHGKRYQKARRLKVSFAKYAPMFVDHPDEHKPGMLWCNVTDSAIARDEMRVKDHIGASKYQKQLPIWKEQEAAKAKKAEEMAMKAKKKAAEEADETRRHAARTKKMAAKKRKRSGKRNGEEAVGHKRQKLSAVTESDK